MDAKQYETIPELFRRLLAAGYRCHEAKSFTVKEAAVILKEKRPRRNPFYPKE